MVFMLCKMFLCKTRHRNIYKIIFYLFLAFLLLQFSHYLPIFVVCPFKTLKLRLSKFVVPQSSWLSSNLTVLEEVPNATIGFNRTSSVLITKMTTTLTTEINATTRNEIQRILIYNNTDVSPMLTLDFYSTVGIGSRMFQYASLFGIAKKNNFTIMIPATLPLREFFNLTSEILDKDINLKSFTEKTDNSVAIYNYTNEKLAKTHILLNGPFQSYRYFDDYRAEIISQFTFSSQVLSEAKIMLQELLLKKNIIWPNTSINLIGLHVRRGTVLSRPHITMGYKAVPIAYIIKAMNFFKKKYKSVFFVVSSDGLLWCRKSITDKDVIFISGQSPAVDMAALILCNHTITTVGAFGWWSAYLTKGEVVYYKDWPVVNSTLNKLVKKEDYFLPSWIGLS